MRERPTVPRELINDPYAIRESVEEEEDGERARDVHDKVKGTLFVCFVRLLLTACYRDV